MTIGSLTALTNLAGKIFDCLYSFGDKLEIIDDFYVVSKRINKMLNLKEEEKENYEYDLDGEIIFSNVTIYIDNKTILENLNFVIKKGEKIAIIGENGSGKTILAKTILGFYNYKGNIYINNHNIKRLNPQNIRDYIELVFGDSYMFSGSILENIVIDNEINSENIEETVRICEMKSDIDMFTNRYDTMIGENGTKLSGGQKQRICMARCLINNKPIIILDEALNKLDNETRKRVLTNLKEKYKNKILILISNNLEIIDYVDSIIYIYSKTVFTGTHKELLEKNENYKKLIEINNNMI